MKNDLLFGNCNGVVDTLLLGMVSKNDSLFGNCKIPEGIIKIQEKMKERR